MSCSIYILTNFIFCSILISILKPKKVDFSTSCDIYADQCMYLFGTTLNKTKMYRCYIFLVQSSYRPLLVKIHFRALYQFYTLALQVCLFLYYWRHISALFIFLYYHFKSLNFNTNFSPLYLLYLLIFFFYLLSFAFYLPLFIFSPRSSQYPDFYFHRLIKFSLFHILPYSYGKN